jgi:hypothetical protein
VLKQKNKIYFFALMKNKSLLVIQKEVHLQTHRNPSPNIKRKIKNIKTLQKQEIRA